MGMLRTLKFVNIFFLFFVWSISASWVQGAQGTSEAPVESGFPGLPPSEAHAVLSCHTKPLVMDRGLYPP